LRLGGSGLFLSLTLAKVLFGSLSARFAFHDTYCFTSCFMAKF
jgi:hypothetical protein